MDEEMYTDMFSFAYEMIEEGIIKEDIEEAMSYVFGVKKEYAEKLTKEVFDFSYKLKN